MFNIVGGVGIGLAVGVFFGLLLGFFKGSEFGYMKCQLEIITKQKKQILKNQKAIDKIRGE